MLTPDNIHKRYSETLIEPYVEMEDRPGDIQWENNTHGGGGRDKGLNNDMDMRGIIIAICLLSLIPLVLWFVSTIADLLFYKWSKIQRKPSIRDCVEILDNYLTEDNVSDQLYYGQGNSHNIFWYADNNTNDDDDDNKKDNSELMEDGSKMEIETRINMTTQKNYRHKYKTKVAPSSTYDYMTSQEKVQHMIHVHKTYCYSRFEESHSTRHYLRGNFILSLIATIKLFSSGIMVVLAMFALNTDPLTVLAFTGVAWTALWFQGGIVDLFRNYLYHFVILSTDKFHPGNIVMLEGHTKEPGCVFTITPIYTVMLTKRSSTTGRSEELLFQDVPNYNFFIYPMTTAYRWKKSTNNKRSKIIPTTNVVQTTPTTLHVK